MITDVLLPAAQTVRTDVRMELAGVLQDAEVSAAAIALHTDTTALGTTIDSRSVSNLPLHGRTLF